MLTGTLLRQLGDDLRKCYYEGLQAYALHSFKRIVSSPDVKWQSDAINYDGNLHTLLTEVSNFVCSSSSFAPLFRDNRGFLGGGALYDQLQ